VHGIARDTSRLRAHTADDTAYLVKAGSGGSNDPRCSRGALVITLLIGIFGMSTGHLCLWRRGDN
jgi:hypothetical protein